MKKQLFLLGIIFIASMVSYGQEGKDSLTFEQNKRIFKDYLAKHKSGKSNLSINIDNTLSATKPISKMPVKKLEGYYPMQIHRPDYSLIYNMPIFGLKTDEN